MVIRHGEVGASACIEPTYTIWHSCTSLVGYINKPVAVPMLWARKNKREEKKKKTQNKRKTEV